MRRFSYAFLLIPLVVAGCGGQPAETPEANGVNAAEETPPAPEAAPPAPETPFRVGAASRTINPDVGVCLGGYEENRASTGVHDDLFAKAVVFHDGETAVGLVVLDALSIQYPTARAIRLAAAEKVTAVPLPAERIVVEATHTHAAPDVIGIYPCMPDAAGTDSAYMESLVNQAVEALVAASEALQPVQLYWAKTEGGDWAVNDSEPGVVDHEVTILQARSAADQTPLVTLTHFACHPTVLDGDNTLTSADWVGPFYARMAEGEPGEHLFLQGPIGAWIQPKTPERTFALAARYGADLAERALAVLPSAARLEGDTIRAAHKTFEIPLETDGFKALAASGVIDRDFGDDAGIPTEVTWFAVGNAQFATHPAETAPTFGWATKMLMDTEPKFVLGLAQDHLGYFCPPKYFEETGSIPYAKYLTRMSPGPQAGPVMMRALQSIVP